LIQFSEGNFSYHLQSGDAAIKVNQAVPGYFNTNNLRDLTGIDSDE
jgi:hypothetical protein